MRRVPLLLIPLIALIAACGSQVDLNAEEIERGRAIYAHTCQSCHGDASTGAGAVPGAPVHGNDGHTWHHADGQLIDIILGELDYQGRTMPSFADLLSTEDVQAILTFFKSNWQSAQLRSQEEASMNWGILQAGK